MRSISYQSQKVASCKISPYADPVDSYLGFIEISRILVGSLKLEEAFQEIYKLFGIEYFSQEI